MKKIFLYAFVFLCSIHWTNAQDSGFIKMEITEVSSENAEIAPFIQMMKGTQTEYYFTPDKSMVKANMMGGMVEMTTIVGNEDEAMTMYMNAMGNKMQIESSKEERDKFDEAKNADVPEYTIEYDENVTKEIMGHTCTKALVTVGEDDAAYSMVMYVAKDLKASNKMIQGLDKIEIDGFPLEYQMNTAEMNMTITTVEFEDEVASDAFEFNSRGYQKMTWEEFQTKMSQMGGGGF